MKIVWVGNKRQIANDKHFGGKLSAQEMDLLILKVIKNATHTGKSDRANAGHEPAMILWGDYAGVKFSIVMDAVKLKKNVVEIVSFYDVHNADHKAKRFGMKEVK